MSCDYSSISFAQFQPMQWGLASNQNARCDPYYVQPEESREKVGQMVQIVVTFDADGSISMYRNGQAYGLKYNSPPLDWASTTNQDTRLIFGVKSSVFVGENRRGDSFEESNLGPNPAWSQTHSAYFHGIVHRAAVIKGALLSEDVLGLYRVREDCISYL